MLRYKSVGAFQVENRALLTIGRISYIRHVGLSVAKVRSCGVWSWRSLRIGYTVGRSGVFLRSGRRIRIMSWKSRYLRIPSVLIGCGIPYPRLVRHLYI